MDPPELRAFRLECEATESTLAAVGPASWSGPGLGEWSLHELGAHLVGGAARLAEYAEQPLPDDAAPVGDRVDYFRGDLAAEAPAVARRARGRADAIPVGGVPGAFAAAWRATEAAVALHGPSALTATLRGPMRLDEYLATRVLEVCVHHLDVRIALDLPPASTPEASRLVMALLEGLLGGPRPRSLGRHRFILAATGRAGSDDPRLPVLR
jgi:uncharacterized protein (TIGR03083 family)